jgi:DtxR family Mn-dependent transcriptional regulator
LSVADPETEPSLEMHSSLTAPAEDYLKAVYQIAQRRGAVSTNDLAQQLGVAPASVSGMVRRLAEQGLLAHEPYRGVRLTSSGRQAALRTLRRHRVIESYLVRALGFPWDRVHEEAERLEHAASDELIDRMAAALGEPAVDPHGAPIPTRDGAVDETRGVPLAELPAGVTAAVARVRDEDASLLRYLAELGIRPGARVCVVARAPFGGPVTLLVEGAERAVGVGVTEGVLVEEGEPRAG